MHHIIIYCRFGHNIYNIQSKILALPFHGNFNDNEFESNFLILISLQPDGINLKYFKLRLCDLTEF